MLNLITPTKFLLPYKVTYSQVPGTRAWNLVGRRYYYAYHTALLWRPGINMLLLSKEFLKRKDIEGEPKVSKLLKIIQFKFHFSSFLSLK